MKNPAESMTYVVRGGRYVRDPVWVIHEDADGSWRYYWKKGRTPCRSTCDKAVLFGAIASGCQVRWASIHGGPASALVAAKQVEIVLDGVDVVPFSFFLKDDAEPSSEELARRGQALMEKIEAVRQDPGNPLNMPPAGVRLHELAGMLEAADEPR